MLFDATCLAETGRSEKPHTGIGIVAYNLLHQFLKTRDVEVTLYCGQHVEHYLPKVKQMMGNPELGIVIHREQSSITPRVNRIISASSGLYQLLGNRIAKICYSVIARPATWILFYVKIILNRRVERMDYQRQQELFNQFDLFFSPMYAPPYCVLRNPRIKKMLLIYDFIPLVLDDYKFIKNIWFRDILRSIRYDIYLFAISKTTENDYNMLFKDKYKQLAPMEVTPIAVNTSFVPHADREEMTRVFEKYGIPNNKKYFFHISTLDARKNIKKAITIFAEVVRHYNIKDLLFVLGGNAGPKFLEKNDRYFKRHNINTENIIATGRIDSEDLPILYSAAEAFVFVSTYEGFGLPLLEAMKCGCPVVASDIPPLVEIANNSAIIVDPASDQQMFEAFSKLYFDANLRGYYKNAAIERADYYTWEKTASMMMASISRLCAKVQ
jgi:glycosyltransferase involved in cell wall biosynthesis